MGKETVRKMRKIDITPVSSHPEITVRRTQTAVSIIDMQHLATMTNGGLAQISQGQGTIRAVTKSREKTGVDDGDEDAVARDIVNQNAEETHLRTVMEAVIIHGVRMMGHQRKTIQLKLVEAMVLFVSSCRNSMGAARGRHGGLTLRIVRHTIGGPSVTN